MTMKTFVPVEGSKLSHSKALKNTTELEIVIILLQIQMFYICWLFMCGYKGCQHKQSCRYFQKFNMLNLSI